ncbi:PREDICTED: mitochondrial outer membrane protein porin 2-like [Prunus mume]|uniref:Mitochondrial outer membrane protein porin 2-like n=1 Tax=Prunus mume TaxID=102107 RepID=A0ABM0P9K0_PRUMU|nr:PREDICTED: mitochondrial outer membrane protein porin 2-like [Prunus mume]
MSKSNHKNKSRPTSKGPPCFSEFGQKAKGLLTSGYSRSQNFSFTTHSDGGVKITSTAAKKGGCSTAAVAGAYTYKNANFDCRIDTDSKITGTLILNAKFLSSTNTSASFSLPDYQSSKLRVRIRQEYAALSTSVALNKSPAITFSAAVGSSSIALGMETEYKTASSSFSKCSAGIYMKSLNSDASIILANKGDLLTASCVLYLNKQKKHAAVVEFTQKLSTKRNTLTVGGSYAVDHQTVVKARLDDHGEFKTVIQYNVRPKSCLAISGEFNTRALDKIPKIGLALSLVL